MLNTASLGMATSEFQILKEPVPFWNSVLLMSKQGTYNHNNKFLLL